MATSKKIFTVQNLAQKLKDAKALVLADYRGLTVLQMSDLRKAVKKAGGELEVIKNTLLKRAAQEVKVSIDDQVLTGPTVALWAWEDEISALKALDQFAQEAGLPEIKFGWLDQKVISLEKIKQLANLPTTEELKMKLLASLQSPSFRLANALSWNLKKLTSVLKARGGES